MIAHSPLDLKLRRLEHTCIASCEVPADRQRAERHYAETLVRVTAIDWLRFVWHLVTRSW